MTEIVIIVFVVLLIIISLIYIVTNNNIKRSFNKKIYMIEKKIATKFDKLEKSLKL